MRELLLRGGAVSILCCCYDCLVFRGRYYSTVQTSCIIIPGVYVGFSTVLVTDTWPRLDLSNSRGVSWLLNACEIEYCLVSVVASGEEARWSFRSPVLLSLLALVSLHYYCKTRGHRASPCLVSFSRIRRRVDFLRSSSIIKLII